MKAILMRYEDVENNNLQVIYVKWQISLAEVSIGSKAFSLNMASPVLALNMLAWTQRQE